jgi:putative ABC transport system ATP-binding protein
VELEGVGKTYRLAPAPALAEVSLTIERGEFVAVMGPSGSGKSTLLNLVAGVDRPTTGRVVVDGIELGRLGEGGLARYRREQVGFVFQFFNLLDNLTVVQNVLIPAQLAGGGGRAVHARALELLERFGIAGRADAYPGRLSGGERQRVAIARALVNRPALLLADEPTGALDSRNGEQVMDLLAELNGAGQTVVLVTHDPALAARSARRLISIRDGSVAGDERPEASPSADGARPVPVGER